MEAALFALVEILAGCATVEDYQIRPPVRWCDQFADDLTGVLGGAACRVDDVAPLMQPWPRVNSLLMPVTVRSGKPPLLRGRKADLAPHERTIPAQKSKLSTSTSADNEIA